MRWERLFTELENQLDDDALLERDALVEELVDGEWTRLPWGVWLTGEVEVEVRGSGLVRGTVRSVSDTVLVLDAGAHNLMVSLRCVTGVSAPRGGVATRAEPLGAVARRLGWSHVFRALRDDGLSIWVQRVDGTTREGIVEAVGQDAVALGSPADQPAPASRRWWIPFEAVALVRSRESP